MIEVYLTIDEAAKRAKVSRNTIKKWMKEGLPVIEFNSRLKRIAVAVFDEWMDARTKIAVGNMVGDVPGLASTENQVVEKTEVFGR